MNHKTLFIYLCLLCLNACSFTKTRKEKDYIEGKYILFEGKSLYDSFSFKGKSTVVIESLGMEFVSSYIKDEEYVRIEAQPSNILLKIETDSTIIGEGFASGLYIQGSIVKQYKNKTSDSNETDTTLQSKSPLTVSSPNNKTQQQVTAKKNNDQKSDVIKKEHIRKAEAEKKCLADEQRKKEQASNKVAGAFGIGGAKGNSTGNQESPFGNSDHGANEGVKRMGTFQLSDRYIITGKVAEPSYTEREEGKIVITIVVDTKGNVISAEIGRGTNIDNSSMRKSALEAARRAKFNSISGANNQSGTITYVYKFK